MHLLSGGRARQAGGPPLNVGSVPYRCPARAAVPPEPRFGPLYLTAVSFVHADCKKQHLPPYTPSQSPAAWKRLVHLHAPTLSGSRLSSLRVNLVLSVAVAPHTQGAARLLRGRMHEGSAAPADEGVGAAWGVAAHGHHSHPGAPHGEATCISGFQRSCFHGFEPARDEQQAIRRCYGRIRSSCDFKDMRPFPFVTEATYTAVILIS